MKQEEIKAALDYASKHFIPSETEGHYALETIKEAADKWAVMEWMWETGFADHYPFAAIMREFGNYHNAYKREMK